MIMETYREMNRMVNEQEKGQDMVMGVVMALEMDMDTGHFNIQVSPILFITRIGL
jgi:hypothetical protein